MSSRSKLVLAALAVLALLVVLLWTGGAGDPAELRPESIAAEPDPVDDDAELLPVDPLTPEPELPERVAVVEEEPAPTIDPFVTPEADFAFELEVRVVDQFGLSADGAEIFAAPIGLPLNRVGAVGADGMLRASWRGLDPTMELAWLAKHRGRSSVLRRERLHADTPHRVLARIANPDGINGRRGNEQVFVLTSFVLHGDGIPDAPPSVVRDEAGRIGFRDPLSWGSMGSMVIQSSGGLTVSFGTGQMRLVSGSQIFVTGSEEETPRYAELRGVVSTTAGDPAMGVPVAAGPNERRVSALALTDAEGGFVLEGLSSGELFLRAGGGPDGIALGRVVVAEGDQLTWHPTLDPGLVLQGRLIDEGGAPLPGWRVELSVSTPDEPWRGAAITQPDGRFLVANCPRVAMRMEVFAGRDEPIPISILDGLLAGGPEQELRLDLRARGKASPTFRVLDLDGQALAGAEARLWHLASERGVRPAHSGEGWRTVSNGVPPGDYLVEVGAAGRGWIELGPLPLVASTGTADLGEVRLPAPGGETGTLTIQLPVSAGEQAPTWSLHRVASPVVAIVVESDDTLPAVAPNLQELEPDPSLVRLELPPAEYVFRVHHPKHGTLDHPLQIDPGGALSLAITLDEDRGWRVEIADPADAPGDGE